MRELHNARLEQEHSSLAKQADAVADTRPSDGGIDQRPTLFVRREIAAAEDPDRSAQGESDDRGEACACVRRGVRVWSVRRAHAGGAQKGTICRTLLE